MDVQVSLPCENANPPTNAANTEPTNISSVIQMFTSKSPEQIIPPQSSGASLLKGAPELRRKHPATFYCTHGNCTSTFTTKYRRDSKWMYPLSTFNYADLNFSAHCNRFHTENQQRFACGKDCGYSSPYKTDCLRHQSACPYGEQQ